jgi:GLPGLI family protein
MKLYIILLFLFKSIFSFTQTLTIEYEKKINAKEAIFTKTEVFRMIFNKNKSIFYGISNDSSKYQYNKFIENVKKIGVVKLIKMDDNTYDYSFNEMLYKDYTKDTLFLNDLIMNKMICIGEKINKIEWIIDNDLKKVILGKNCISAKTNFRGRTYIAFFTTDIRGISTGPWKFDGLPGIILSVKSEDGYVSFEAVKMSIQNIETEISNPFKKTDNISWEVFKEQYKSTLLNTLKRMSSLSGEGESGSIEITDRIEDLGIKKLKF